MKLQNHFNETVEVETIKLLESITGYHIKVLLTNGQTEYWDYDNFMLYNPEWEWVDGE